MTRNHFGAALLCGLVAACAPAGDDLDDCDTETDTDACDDRETDGAVDNDDPFGGTPIDPDDAPPPSLSADVHDIGGAFLRAWSADLSDTFTSNLASNTFLVSATTEDTTLLTITIWANPTAGGTWDVEDVTEGGLPSGVANVVFLDAGFGGRGTGGTVTVTSWRPTTLPALAIASGTFTVTEVVNEDDPTWGRELRNGTFEGLRVTVSPL